MSRDLGFMAWKNDLAYLESPATDWKKIVDSENAMFTDALDDVAPKVKEFKKSLNSVSEPWSLEKGWEIKRSPFSPEQMWTFVATGFKCKVWDGDVYDEFFAGAVKDSDGFERFTVKVFESGKQVANLQKVGPYVAWLKGSLNLVYLGSSRDLRYDSVHLWNPKTGSSKALYTLKDPTENLELGRSEDGSVYVMRTDFVTKHLGFVTGQGVDWVDKASNIFVVSRNEWIRNMDAGIESMSSKAQWSITLDHGIRTLWKLNKLMITVWGEISFDTREPHILHVSDMRYEPYVVNTKSASWSLSTPKPYEFPCSYYTDVAPTFVVRPRPRLHAALKKKPIKGLLVTAYGAYGTPTKVGNLVPRWRPLLENGWAIASVCVPGSGDNDIAWKEAGQRQNRGEAIRVFTETIQRLQEELGIEPSATALYGRSAGGLLVISAATLTPGLVGALYVESPYVDVLRTISNPDLPLTLLETKEFGIGTNPTNVLATGAWSPMEHIPATPAKGIPELFVVARSDLADLEVYPYEVVKWIWRLRSLPESFNKLLYIHTGQGHFTTGFKSRAEDLALLDSWLEASAIKASGIKASATKASATRKKNRSYKYKKMANGMTRKNRKNITRKNRKNSKNRNAVTMGGKRRRSGRRGSRKH